VLIELDPVDRITADAVGAPGQRTFFLQGRKDDRLVTLLMEKQQVQLLAASVVEILSRLGKETGEGPADEAMGLEEPVMPEWRAGRLSIEYEEGRDLILLEVEELVEGDADDDDEEDDDAGEASTEGPLLAEFDVVLQTGEEELEEYQAAEEEEDDEALEALGVLGGPDDALDDAERSRVRFWATREQMLSLARHGATVCAAGRPRCQLCGNPMDPEGHQCPALNGHRELAP
jgi:uncharacterized repeat protein (TIGR03847 family)